MKVNHAGIFSVTPASPLFPNLLSPCVLPLSCILFSFCILLLLFIAMPVLVLLNFVLCKYGKCEKSGHAKTYNSKNLRCKIFLELYSGVCTAAKKYKIQAASYILQVFISAVDVKKQAIADMEIFSLKVMTDEDRKWSPKTTLPESGSTICLYN